MNDEVGTRQVEREGDERMWRRHKIGDWALGSSHAQVQTDCDSWQPTQCTGWGLFHVGEINESTTAFQTVRHLSISVDKWRWDNQNTTTKM